MKRLFGGKKKHRQSDEMSLQVTSMADIFTILLVFLLKGYATSAVTVSPSKDVRIPAADGAVLNTEALQVEISESAILVANEKVASLKNYRFEGDVKAGSGGLLAALEKEKKRRTLISQANDSVKDDGKVIIVSDEKVPYGTLKAVLNSTAIHGYTDVKLAVMKD